MVGIRHELRRSSALVALPLLFGVSAVAAFRFLWPGFSVWDNASAAVVSSVFLLGPLAAGLAAWAGTRERRRRTEYLRLLTARHPTAPPLVELAAALIWPLVAYAAVTAAVFAKTAVNATWGHPNGLWVAAGAAGLALHAVVGYIAGRAFPHVWLPPTVAVVAYVVAAWGNLQYRKPWFFLSAVNTQEGGVFDRLNSTLFAGQIAWYLGLAGTAVLAWITISTPRRRAITLACLVAAATLAGGGAAVVRAQHNRLDTKPADFAYRCSATQPEICVHPAFANELPALTREFTALHRRVADTPLDFVRLEQRARPGTGAFTINYIETSGGTAKLALSSYLFAEVEPEHRCPPAGVDIQSREAGDYFFFQRLVVAWLLDDPSMAAPVRPEQRAALAWFAGLTVEQQREWFASHYQQFTTCALTREDFR
jgi:hypothetical protein